VCGWLPDTAGCYPVSCSCMLLPLLLLLRMLLPSPLLRLLLLLLLHKYKCRVLSAPCGFLFSLQATQITHVFLTQLCCFCYSCPIPSA